MESESLAVFRIVRAFGHPTRNAVRIAAASAQVGEFSSSSPRVGLGPLPQEGQNLILAGAVASTASNPLASRFADALERRRS